MLISGTEAMSKADGGTARRIELFTGVGHRRIWSGDEKAAIVAESYLGAESVCATARRHGLTPTQLFTWRREARRKTKLHEPPAFVPAVIETALRKEPARRRKDPSKRPAAIEVEIDGVVARIGRGADAATIAAVVEALKARR
ncbi:MAG TPA: transposase [Hansschlegelia sp.]